MGSPILKRFFFWLCYSPSLVSRSTLKTLSLVRRSKKGCGPSISFHFDALVLFAGAAACTFQTIHHLQTHTSRNKLSPFFVQPVCTCPAGLGRGPPNPAQPNRSSLHSEEEKFSINLILLVYFLAFFPALRAVALSVLGESFSIAGIRSLHSRCSTIYACSHTPLSLSLCTRVHTPLHGAKFIVTYTYCSAPFAQFEVVPVKVTQKRYHNILLLLVMTLLKNSCQLPTAVGADVRSSSLCCVLVCVCVF